MGWVGSGQVMSGCYIISRVFSSNSTYSSITTKHPPPPLPLPPDRMGRGPEAVGQHGRVRGARGAPPTAPHSRTAEHDGTHQGSGSWAQGT